ncbi:DUF2207 domain-containing protein [Lysobacter sp. CFH 32150]|uniref:DUF2207 domain-containing protein n=1 Tax=Lysobacter sp. CFH 32150 TaxID=2927128 RepID=UPI001FA776E2|nr:DUF2207 domain-containing protein [Lysobacter sp. CFH 32150]MCI4569327.1 DUF2207 domain-containing protein [Lysobacter sp. CFH 32150]
MSIVFKSRIGLALLSLLLATPLLAQERITSYDSEIDVRTDGSIDVTERITVHAEGSSIRRGIYRDFPTRYKDRYGNRVVVDFEVLDVKRNGRTEPWFTERQSNGVRINTGNDDFLPVPADYTYTLRYRTTRQLGFFGDHDELYWNAIGTGWDFPIESASVEARLPQAVPVDQLHAEGYTGYQGAQEQGYRAEIPAPGVARWQLTQPLSPQQGFTVVLTFPKGLVTAPTRAQRILWFLKDNRGVLVAWLGLIGLLVYCVRRWKDVGRDPRPGIIIARYDPPSGHSPAGLRYMRRMRYDNRCFSSDLLALAVDGQVRIHRDDGFLKDKWRLERLEGVKMAGATDTQRALLERLFASGPMLELKNTNASTMQGAQQAHTKVLDQRFQPDLFNRHGKSIAVAFAIAAGSIGLGFLIGMGTGVPALVATAVLMVLILVAFAILVKAPTPAGRKLLDEIEGLKLYLSVAEREELARMPGPDAPPVLDAKRYEHLLPYAVALDVEDAWTKKFTLAVGAAAAAATTAAISWYRGGQMSDLGSFTNSIGSALSSQIASSSTPPGSSSGSGGGGSSGGGGGGGGGGGR